MYMYTYTTPERGQICICLVQEVLQYLCIDEDAIEEGTDREMQKLFEAAYSDSEDSTSSGRYGNLYNNIARIVLIEYLYGQ